MPADWAITCQMVTNSLTLRSVHYQRIHPAYWTDRLQRLKALGANALQARPILLPS